MSQTKHSDALVLVYDGATMLLQHDQVNIYYVTFTCQNPAVFQTLSIFLLLQEESGLDLCQLMLKCFEETDHPVNDEALGITIII